MNKTIFVTAVFALCSCQQVDSNESLKKGQESLMQEAVSATGMPAIKNFRERRLLKSIFEMRDQEISTFTYIANADGKLVFLCNSIGFGIPYATQYTNPQKLEYGNSSVTTISQADPNALFSPGTAEGTWVMCKDPNGSEVKPVLIEPRIVVSPFELGESAVTALVESTKPIPE